MSHFLHQLRRTRGLATSASTKKVAFFGLGNMGFHMVNNLMKKAPEFSVSAYDLNPDVMAKVKSIGATPAASVAEAASGAQVVITMLPGNDHVKGVYEEAERLIGQSCLCIDSSTIDPILTRDIHAALTAKGHSYVDAPVSGGIGGAEAGTLTFMVGGSVDDYNKSARVLEHMGANIVHCGDSGTGQVAKLCNNLVLGISMVGVSEAMNLGETLGIDLKVLAGILNTSTARCWSSDTYNPAPGVIETAPSSRDYEGGFASALMLKDLGLVTDVAKKSGVPLPAGANVHAFYQLMVSKGLGSKDFSVAYKFLNDNDKDK